MGSGGDSGVLVGSAIPVLPCPVQVLLEQELEQLSEELDKDMRDMETRRTPRQVPGHLLLPLGPRRASSCEHITSSCGLSPSAGCMRGTAGLKLGRVRAHLGT